MSTTKFWKVTKLTRSEWHDFEWFVRERDAVATAKLLNAARSFEERQAGMSTYVFYSAIADMFGKTFD